MISGVLWLIGALEAIYFIADLPEDVNRSWSRSVRPWRMAVVTVKESIQEIIHRL